MAFELSQRYRASLASRGDPPPEPLSNRQRRRCRQHTPSASRSGSASSPSNGTTSTPSRGSRSARGLVDDFNRTNRWKKRGIAMVPLKYGIGFKQLAAMNTASALVQANKEDGSITVIHGGVEMGQGLHTKIAQVAASELNAPLEYVRVTGNNTDAINNAPPTAASTGFDLNGAPWRRHAGSSAAGLKTSARPTKRSSARSGSTIGAASGATPGRRSWRRPGGSE